MPYLDTFFAKAESIVPRANYFKLQQLYIAKKKVVHLFVENDDDFEFYRTTINYVYRDFEARPYSLKGKSNLIECFAEIDWSKFDRSNVLFFADKDYDDILNVDQIKAINFFYTSYYSIENYLVNQKTFAMILDRFFTEIPTTVVPRLMALFDEAYAAFQRKVTTLTWFILIDREISKKAELDEFKMHFFMHFESMVLIEKKLISINNYNRIIRDPKSTSLQKSILRKYSIKEILEDKCNAGKGLFTHQNIMNKRKLVKKISEPKFFIRGKYDLWFLLELIKTVDKALKDIYKEEKRVVDDKNPIPRKKIDINTDNIFDLISSKISGVDDVKHFLETNYNTLHGYN